MPTAKKVQGGAVTSSKKKSAPKRNKSRQHGDDRKASRDSTRVLSRFLMFIVSIIVAAAAILIKPLLDKHHRPIRDDRSVSLLDDPAGNVSTWPRPDPRVAFLVGRACLGSHKGLHIRCHDALRVSKRHFRATRRIEPGEILFEIPRSLQIWDLDALRDPWIRLHLFEAYHRQSGNRVGSEAYLAAYLALEFKRRNDTSRDWYMEILELAYYDTLFNFGEWLESHPILGDPEHLKQLLGFSEGCGVLQGYRNMILSEYEAFADFSKKFGEMVSREEYFSARLNVLTRAIRVGPPGPEHAIEVPFLKDVYTRQQLLHDELDSYKDILGIDLERDGSIALVPIADLFNHHPQNNVEFEFKQTELNNEGAMILRADNRRIEKGFEPMISYGRKIPDAHLFARYGFVNGDGSGTTQVSLAVYHDILRLNINSQFDYFPASGLTTRLYEFLEAPLADYLKFDDGYLECIPGIQTHPEEADLKLLKHKHLLKIANLPKRWQILVPEANPYSFPNTTHDYPIVLEPPKPIIFYIEENLNLTLQLTTCRLMSLIHTDLEGKAAQLLRDNLKNSSFYIEEGNDSLEYRTWMCIRRWMGAAYMMLDEGMGAVGAESQLIYKLSTGNNFGTRDWGAASVRLGELLSLRIIANIAEKTIAARWGTTINDLPPYYSREYPCPEEYQKFLLDEMEKNKYEIDL